MREWKTTITIVSVVCVVMGLFAWVNYNSRLEIMSRNETIRAICQGDNPEPTRILTCARMTGAVR
jgi:hypothetical protein